MPNHFQSLSLLVILYWSILLNFCLAYICQSIFFFNLNTDILVSKLFRNMLKSFTYVCNERLIMDNSCSTLLTGIFMEEVENKILQNPLTNKFLILVQISRWYSSLLCSTIEFITTGSTYLLKINVLNITINQIPITQNFSVYKKLSHTDDYS